MISTKILVETTNLTVKLITLLAGESVFLQHHDDKHSLVIPIAHMERDVPYDILINYLLHHAPPNQYYSLHHSDSSATEEMFVQFLWRKLK